MERLSVQALQAGSYVGDPDPRMGSLRCRGQAGAVVIDAERECAVGAESRNSDRTPLDTFCDAMFDRVLDHGLQNQAGNLGQQEFLGNIDAKPKTIDKSHLLNFKILSRKL